MKTLVHLSDLHFGRIDPAVCAAIVQDVLALNPDIVVVSGDLTQRARTSEFKQAREFLKTLPRPQLIVPGNHDVPLYNIFLRTFRPLARYKSYITSDLQPFYADSELAIAGVNTARSLTFKDGRINRSQIDWVISRFDGLPETVTKVVVTHHPFEGGSAENSDGIVGRGKLAMEGFSRSRVEMILSGHLHLHRIVDSAVRYKIDNYSALLIQAGTATSERRRREANSFNVIRIDRPRIELETRTWDAELGFTPTSTRRFILGRVGLAAADGESIATITNPPGAPTSVPQSK